MLSQRDSLLFTVLETGRGINGMKGRPNPSRVASFFMLVDLGDLAVTALR